MKAELERQDGLPVLYLFAETELEGIALDAWARQGVVNANNVAVMPMNYIQITTTEPCQREEPSEAK